ncbi:MAG: lysylphosphatidylglycerol synthase transmembrane domain-containing protein [Candidatus Korobacteraceae bacterium]
MKKKQIFSLVVVAGILGALVYFQFRSWRTFDWAKFRHYTGGVSLWHIGAGVGLIYLAYVMRAIRWAIFLKPTAPTSVRRLIAPQIIGFAALGLFGRAGEFARPYLIARKEKLTFTSQLAVWTVERFFDLGSVVVLMGTFLALNGGELARDVLQAVHGGVHSAMLKAGHKLPLVLAGLAALAVLAFLLKRASGKSAGHLRARLVSFKQGFNTIHDTKSFVQLVLVSLCMWLMIAGAYVEVLHAYPQIPVLISGDTSGLQRLALINTINLAHVLVIMGCSMFGSVLQLPGGVGGSQLAVIGILQTSWFAAYNITPELAVSCGIMLWLVTFMSVIPAGVLLARYEKISFARLSEESTQEEEEVEAEEARTH